LISIFHPILIDIWVHLLQIRFHILIFPSCFKIDCVCVGLPFMFYFLTYWLGLIFFALVCIGLPHVELSGFVFSYIDLFCVGSC
jgi:hypothetical protein